MSQPLQFGLHPDADQISAFVEQALPAHEREQLLDHLAVCAECRDLVALSLPELEAPAPAEPVAVRKPWWLGWNLAWPVAAAITALILVAVHFHHTAVAPEPMAPTQIASANLPAQPVVEQRPPTAAVKPFLRGSQAQQGGNSHAASASGSGFVAKQNRRTESTGQSTASLPVNGRNLATEAELAEAPRISPAGSSSQSAGRGTGSAGGSVNGLAESRSPVLAPAPLQATADRPEALTKAAGPPAASQTVAVSGAMSAETVPTSAANLDVTVDEEQIAQLIQLKHRLPSHLAVLSMAAHGSRIVAIDMAHAVFVSNDAGKHWKTIQMPWRGRAVKTDLVQFGTEGALQQSLRNTVTAGASRQSYAVAMRGTNGAATAQDPALSTTNGSILGGTVTDITGAAISGASVTLIGATSNSARTVKTDGAGHYLIPWLAGGTYTVEAQAPGFQKKEVAGIAVPASGQVTANLTLTIGAATQTVSVAAANVQSDTSAEADVKSKANRQPAPVFAITTDDGDRWTSSDGVLWKRM